MQQNKILLVEDNQDDITLTLKALKSNNILNEIIVISDGAEALDYCFCKGKYSSNNINELSISIILLDIKLPKIDGIEILRSLRTSEKYKYQPIVILTSSLDECDIVKSYNLGANSFIQKPVDLNNFFKIVKELGMYWLLLNKPMP
ncbi:MAG TPA: response regulator [Ignavibacteriaceae bacterium]|nr:response regulator [Ignavibacteriaceae bacterium]